MTMSTVLVVGCGIVGPVISLLLKRKGYEPIIVEKVKEHGDAGLGLGLFPNGYVSACLPYHLTSV